MAHYIIYTLSPVLPLLVTMLLTIGDHDIAEKEEESGRRIQGTQGVLGA